MRAQDRPAPRQRQLIETISWVAQLLRFAILAHRFFSIGAALFYGVRRHRNLAIAIGVAAVAVRLMAINQPFVDNWSWRQSDVAAIAHNYFHNGFNFAYPQIDWAGDQPGYVGTEFPILPFLAALAYKFAGVHEWIGRLQAVILFAASLPFFFLLVREIFGAGTATWATFFYSFAPLNIFAGREFMPDVPSLSLSIIGLYFSLRWIDPPSPRLRRGKPLTERSTSFLTAAVCVSLSILIKAPSALIGAPLLYLAWQKFRGKMFRQSALWLFAAITLLPSLLWYWHAHQIAEKFYPHHFFGAGGIKLENLSWYWKIFLATVTTSLTPVLTVLTAIGLFVALRNKRAHLFLWWLVAMGFLAIVVGYGNRHAWYQLPFVPIFAAFAGAACAFFASKISARSIKITLSILLAASFGLFSFVSVRPFYSSASSGELRAAGLKLKESTTGSSLIVAADIGDPTIFYYAERKGWHFLEKDGIYQGDPRDSEQAITNLEQLRQRGATHLVLTRNTFWWLDYYKDFAEHLAQTAVILEANPQFQIYELRSQ